MKKIPEDQSLWFELCTYTSGYFKNFPGNVPDILVIHTYPGGVLCQNQIIFVELYSSSLFLNLQDTFSFLF